LSRRREGNTPEIRWDGRIASPFAIARLFVLRVDMDHARRHLTYMKTTVSSKGQIVLPAEFRQMDRIEPGQEFDIERLALTHDLIVATHNRSDFEAAGVRIVDRFGR